MTRRHFVRHGFRWFGLSSRHDARPLLSATIASSARRGWKAGPLIVFGHGVLELLLIIALMAGLSTTISPPPFSEAKAEVTTVIAAVGGALLSIWVII